MIQRRVSVVRLDVVSLNVRYNSNNFDLFKRNITQLHDSPYKFFAAASFHKWCQNISEFLQTIMRHIF